MFWERFDELCSKNNIAPNAVAKIIGVSNATSTKWKGGSIPNGETLIKIADYFECSIDYLLDRTDEPGIAKCKISGDISLTEEEREVLTLMDTLNQEGIKQLVKHTRYIAADDDYKKDNKSGYAQEA